MKRLTVKCIARCAMSAWLLGLAGCDPQALVNKYFKDQGLNPLKIVRDDIQPGQLILKKGGNDPVLADLVSDYTNVPLSSGQKDDKLDGTSDFKAVMKATERERKVDASGAVKFLETVLPVSVDADLGLTNDLKIDAINVVGHRMSTGRLQRYLSDNSSKLHQFIDGQQGGTSPYIAYEVYTADTLNIVANSGTDVTTKVEMTAPAAALSSGNGSFTYKRTSKDTLTIKGTHPYVFAIRTAKLDYKNNVYVLQITNFANGAVKAAGGEEKYSSPLQNGFGAVAFSKLSK